MQSGAYDRRVTILRRLVEADGAGNERGAFVAAFERWVAWFPLGGRRQDVAGLAEGVAEARITLRFDRQTRSLCVADRIRLAAEPDPGSGLAAAPAEFAILAVDPPDRARGYVRAFVARQTV